MNTTANIVTKIARTTQFVSYTEFAPSHENFIQIRLMLEELKRMVMDTEPHAAVLPAGERHAAITVNQNR